MACLIEPLRAAQVAPTIDLAVARFRDARALRQALADRKVIERAKGLLMAQERLTEDEAFRRLRRSAMDTQRPLAEIARAILFSTAVCATAKPTAACTSAHGARFAKGNGNRATDSTNGY